MISPNTLELAKQGDVDAIASSITYLLQDQAAIAKALYKDGCLMVLLESKQIPDQELSVQNIQKLMNKLAVPTINSIKIFAKEKGKDKAAWIKLLKINESPDRLAEIEKIQEIQQQNQSDKWPEWFPYPSSWLRTLLLVLWIAIVFRINAFWGILFSTTSPGNFFLFIGLALLLSAIVFAYLHHCFLGKSPSNWPRWLPGPLSLGEGIYAPVVMVISSLTVLITVIPFLPILECGLQTTYYAQSYCFQNYLQQYHLEKVAIGVWIFVAVYLYQFEYLIRRHFATKAKRKSQGIKPQKVLNDTESELDNLRGEMGSIQMKKGVLNSPPTQQKRETGETKPKQRGKKLIIVLLFFVSIGATYTWAKWSEIQQILPVNFASEKPAIVTPTVTPTQPSLDSFKEAVNQAMSAAKLTQTAKTKEEWNQVVSLWEKAIAHLNLVPQTHPNYAKAQQKITEYQRNLEYAKLAASRAQ
ncbi:hypothetical protein NIES2119_20545 [[Phormidium ambiguum] IAM M-71]|uniref:Uncharacterized protein n=1 Tax=[Phormidium ambiguum] IAM M-71 TaxID=454136 RepID=A0A1U7IET8_9CYAN|nr:hypothetical protein [Phormidium ambiguum]OKH35411.1 hypothetical protein NIES2119_20545 [Phormidium ambiguum IAM M-71]